MSLSELRAGLIGAHIGQSRLKAALALMCRAANITLDFTLIDTAAQPVTDFAARIDACRDAGWTGITVTHPWKPDAAHYASGRMSKAAEGFGAANTLIFGPPLAGHNTDYTGFLSAWRERFGDTPPGRVAMAGAGGVAHAIAPALVSLGATDLVIWDTRPGVANDLVARLDGPVARAVAPDAAPGETAAADGLVNCTPLGMGANTQTAFPSGFPRQPRWAFEAVYTPVMTPFARSARGAGAELLTGFDLFRHMAMDSFAAYTGLRPDPDKLRAQLLALKPT